MTDAPAPADTDTPVALAPTCGPDAGAFPIGAPGGDIDLHALTAADLTTLLGDLVADGPPLSPAEQAAILAALPPADPTLTVREDLTP